MNWPEWSGGLVTGILNMGLVVLGLLVMFGLLVGAGAAVWRVAQLTRAAVRMMRKRG